MRSDRESEINAATETETATLLNWKEALRLLPFHQAEMPINHADSYPLKLAHRYNTYIWSEENQACYTPAEIKLLNQIRAEYKQLADKVHQDAPYFELTQEKSWREMMVCTLPSFKELNQRLESGSFTLPNRAGKDTRQFPLWKFAEDMAKQIANWQGMRIKQQKIARMNDPVMLVFEQLRHWFFDELANKECKKEDIDVIAAMQSYIKNIIHLIPDFGADRSHLHDIQRRLEEAGDIMRTCMANQKLPALLSTILIAGRSLENTIATYLHFMTDDDVADNCATSYLEGSRKDCDSSPICKLYKAADQQDASLIDLQRFQPLSKFYQVTQLSEKEGVRQASFKLQPSLIRQSGIHFASFFTEQDKMHYLHALATLDALVNVRKTLEQFHQTQEKLGTYLFALHYQEKANQLTENYSQLIDKTAGLLKNLLRTTDDGLERLLRQPHPLAKSKFLKNFRSLETKVVEKGKTASLQLDAYCQKALASLASYKEEMKKLAVELRSGVAKQELQQEMQHLFGVMHDINTMLPVILAPSELTVQTNMTLPDAQAVVAPSPLLQSMPLVAQTTSVSRVESLQLDPQVNYDEITGRAIFTYRAYQKGQAIGAIKFYGVPSLQLSAEGQHNIVSMSGVFCDIAREAQVETPLCTESVAETRHWLHALTSAGVNGALYGGANVMEEALQRLGLSDNAAYITREISYYGAVFAWRFYSYCAEDYFYAMPYQYTQAICKAGIDTGKLALSNYAFKGLSWIIHRSANALYPQGWTHQGWGKTFNTILRFGFFAENVFNRGLPEAAATQAVGMTTQLITEWSGEKLMGEKKAALKLKRPR